MKKIVKYLVGIIAIALVYLLISNFNLIMYKIAIYQQVIVEKISELTENELPTTENLIDTIERVMVYWNSDIVKDLEAGKRVIIAAHGNSLRGLIKYLDNMTDEEIIKLELQTGNPICYELDENLKPIRHYYLK